METPQIQIPSRFARGLVFFYAFLMGGVAVAEDCNNNGRPDDDEVAGRFVDTSPILSFTIPEGLVAHVVPVPPEAASIVEIEIISQFSAPGDVVFAINGSQVATAIWSGGSSCGLHQTTLLIDAADFNALTDPSSNDGNATYLIEINGTISCDGSGGTLTITTRYDTVPVPDCNNNGVPDECDPDCNSNGVPDECDPDCNEDGVVDGCGTTDTDCNNNGVLDECEDLQSDCNSNGVPDECELGWLNDCNDNGVPDDCELVGNDCNGDGIPDECGLSPTSYGVIWVIWFGAIPDDDQGGVVLTTNPLPGLFVEDIYVELGITHEQQGDLVVELSHNGTTVTLIDNCGGSSVGCTENPDGYSANNFGSFNDLLVLDDSAPVGIDCYAGPANDMGIDNYAGPAMPHQSLAAFIGHSVGGEWRVTVRDAIPGHTGVLEYCHLIWMETPDCNLNGVPDECELAGNDCDGDGIPNDCEIAGGAPDCDGDGVPDDCELAGADCNSNGIPDDCEIAGGAPDCNADGVPDVCEVVGADCNSNGIPDDCEIAGGAPDCNANSLPDECEVMDPGPFVQHSRLMTSGAGERFGGAVAASGGIAVVGASAHGDAGAGFVYRRVADDWVYETTLADSALAIGAGIGASAAISGDTILLGAPDDNAVLAFRYNGVSWAQDDVFVAGNLPEGFGHAVAVEGDVALVGAPLDDEYETNSGAVYVLRRSGQNWLEEAKLSAPVPESDAQFGYSVSLSGGVAVIGEWRRGPGVADGADLGSASVFRYDGGSWQFESELASSVSLAAFDKFGTSVAVSGDVAIVGAEGADGPAEASGAAYVFRFNGAAWLFERKLTESVGEFANFGHSVSIMGDIALVGANREDVFGFGSGTAFSYHFNGLDWHKTSKMIPCNGAEGDQFGASVALTTNAALVGAWLDDAAGGDAGSMYAFYSAGADCDGNGIPDECELAANDCNADGIHDACGAPCADCNSNGAPDECELTGNDCDGNGVPDDCQVDLDGDGVPDPCDVCPGFDDNLDSDGDGIPDGCDAPCGALQVGDVDGNGVVEQGDVDSMTVILLDPALGTIDQRCAADVNEDGSVNGIDIQAFVQLLLAP